MNRIIRNSWKFLKSFCFYLQVCGGSRGLPRHHCRLQIVESSSWRFWLVVGACPFEAVLSTFFFKNIFFPVTKTFLFPIFTSEDHIERFADVVVAGWAWDKKTQLFMFVCFFIFSYKYLSASHNRRLVYASSSALSSLVHFTCVWSQTDCATAISQITTFVNTSD